ncbi:MAG TPA: Ig-like domain-containing protein [Acidimicrobiales bacterium]|nr:Ig-like domain-containing protein [Acidimicrobiales bacterium]
MKLPHIPGGRKTAIGVLVAALVVAGAGATAAVVVSRDGSTPAGASPTGSVGVVAPTVRVADDVAGVVPWDRPLRIEVDNGTIAGVPAVRRDGHRLIGLRGDGSHWATIDTLVPTATYEVQVKVLDAAGRTTSVNRAVKAADAPRHLHGTITPGDDTTVGVGMPVIVTFNQDVPPDARAAVASRLTVSATPPVDGAWHWMSPHEVHWRPPTYWPAGTAVTATVALDGVDAGGGLWGEGSHTSTFRIGDAHVSTADIAAHTFTVTSNGAVVKTVPMSAGRDKYPTKGGIHIALEKSQVVTMDSATVGIPRDSPDGYYEKVYWDVRISNGGAFVHAAPWSVGDQGVRNVSHGCVNLSNDEAQWFYDFSRRGDVVDIINSGVGPDLWDAGMADWNVPWDAWRAGSPPPPVPAGPDARSVHPGAAT